METLLLTGITGFIGKSVAKKLIGHYEITALIRPKTNKKRYAEFIDKVNFVEIDLGDIKKLKQFLEKKAFTYIVHIGALRGGRKFSKEEYQRANVFATEQLVLNAVKNQSKLLFCSSVGVFGAIPLELPANNYTPKQEDNYYHYTKIRSEAIIQKYVLAGNLNAYILRPAITYGGEDFGFPFTLIKLIDKKMLFYPNKPVRLHMTHIDLITEAFVKALKSDHKSGKEWIIADEKPVIFEELIQFISEKLHHKPYPLNRKIDSFFFEAGEKVSRFFKNELWISRFELISKNWYYDVNQVYEDLNLKRIKTIPGFKQSIEWYKKLK
jgi:nucleoside-diphosphate-sugar epimerase